LATAKKAKIMRDQLRNPKGDTATKEFRLLGCIPEEIYKNNADFFADDDNVRRWLAENHAFRVGKL